LAAGVRGEPLGRGGPWTRGHDGGGRLHRQLVRAGDFPGEPHYIAIGHGGTFQPTGLMSVVPGRGNGLDGGRHHRPKTFRRWGGLGCIEPGPPGGLGLENPSTC